MLSFGEKLRQERENRDTTLEEIAGTTKIQMRFLEALERNDFEVLPGAAFGKFYIRAYAEVLRIDPQPLIADYDRERFSQQQAESEGVPPVEAPSAPRETRPEAPAEAGRQEERKTRRKEIPLRPRRAAFPQEQPPAPVTPQISPPPTELPKAQPTLTPQATQATPPQFLGSPETRQTKPPTASPTATLEAQPPPAPKVEPAAAVQTEEPKVQPTATVEAKEEPREEIRPAVAVRAKDEPTPTVQPTATVQIEDEPPTNVGPRGTAKAEDGPRPDEPTAPPLARRPEPPPSPRPETPVGRPQAEPRTVHLDDAETGAPPSQMTPQFPEHAPAARRTPLFVAVLSIGVLLVAGWVYFALIRGGDEEGMPITGTEVSRVIPPEPLAARPEQQESTVPQPPPIEDRAGDDARPDSAGQAVADPSEPIADSPEDIPVEAPVAPPPPEVAVEDSGQERVAEARTEPPPPEPAAEAPASVLTVPDFGVGQRVVNRRLEGRTDQFEEGSVAWFTTRVLGGRPGEHIRHVWLREGKRIQSIKLELGGSHWRTHSRKTLWGVGQWAVEARDSEGRVLARADFACVPRK